MSFSLSSLKLSTEVLFEENFKYIFLLSNEFYLHTTLFLCVLKQILFFKVENYWLHHCW